MAVQDLIQQLLPYLLQQPVSRADLLTEAHQLYDPTYDQQYSEAQGDYGLQGTRLGEDYATSQAASDRSRSRLLEDTATSRAQLDRARGALDATQTQETGALNEQLAQMGIAAPGGIGDIQRGNLTRSQLLARQGLQDQYDTLDRSSSRGLQDLGVSADQMARTYNRSAYDLATGQYRGLRQINRNRSAAIEGYATNPAYMFPGYGGY